MADFLVALADFDRKRLWVELGYSSLFHFLHRELGMSKGAAHYRKTAAELIQRVPEVVEAPVSRPVATERAAPRALAEPLTADLRRLHVTVSKRFLEKLEGARDALSHSHPGADAEAILEAGLDLLIERHAKRKGIVAKLRKASSPLARTAGEEKGEGACKPMTRPSTEESRHIPAHIQREVWIRDGGRCQWPIDGGGICGSTHRIQLDHIVPRARGGGSTVGNLRLACQVHNLLAARQVFGEAFMGRFTTARPAGALLDSR